MNRAADLRHPERAAAWLRAQVLRELRSGGDQLRGMSERRAVLAELGLAEPATDAVGQLSLEERAALIAASVEGMEPNDVATILGRDPAATRRRVTAARAKYLAAASHWLGTLPSAGLAGGALARRVEEAAARAIGPRPVVRAAHD
jgi:DNA-directed RNA polymerase specialized sigma24 family protein